MSSLGTSSTSSLVVFLVIIAVVMNVTIIFQLQQALIQQTTLLQELQEQQINRDMRSNVSRNTLQNITEGLYTFVEEAEISSQNQSEMLLPIFFASFNQTERIEELVQNLSEVLAQQRFTEKEIRDNQVVIADDLDRIRSLLNLTSFNSTK